MKTQFLTAAVRGGLLAACAGAALAASPAAADTIFSNYGPGQTYDDQNGWAVNGASTPEFPGYLAQAAGFTASVSANVTQIDLAAYAVAGTPAFPGVPATPGNSGTPTLDVSLWTDVGGVPTAELGSWTVNSISTFHGFTEQAPLVVDVTGVSVIAGDNYFVELTPGNPLSLVTWQDNPTDAAGPMWSSFLGPLTTQPEEAFAVLDGVPEPAAWTLMLAGFALTGAAIRRRRSSPTPA